MASQSTNTRKVVRAEKTKGGSGAVVVDGMSKLAIPIGLTIVQKSLERYIRSKGKKTKDTVDAKKSRDRARRSVII